MSSTSPVTSPVQIESLFDRSQRPRVVSFRRSKFRTVCTFLLLVVLVALIGGYLFITDPDRVRRLSEHYLSELSGGPVRVKRASLSIFEGLRLDDIRIDTDHRRNEESLLFEAKSLHIAYDPTALLFGRIDATRILALEPRMHLVENVDAGHWNFQELDKPKPPTTPTDVVSASHTPAMPEVILRNARVDYAQIAQGKRSAVGTLTIEGQLTPDPENRYRFRLQSRGGTSGVFPIAEGWLAPGSKQLGVTVRDVEFVDEIKTILPAVVRRFWEDHQLAGRIGETRISYFSRDTGKSGFRVETDLDGVKLTIDPNKMLGPREQERIARWRRTFSRLSSPVWGGSPLAKGLIDAISPSPLQMDEVDGTFVFTDESIHISSLVARVENNRFKITGESSGYSPTSPFKMRVESLKSENIVIPDSPRYISSLPWSVQQTYYRFRPKGAMSFWMEIARDQGADRPTIAGEVRIHDASFMFDRFPYPVDRAGGTLRLDTDPATGRERLEVVALAGRGYRGGANENATVEVTGHVSPLDETAGGEVIVRGRGMRSERLLIESMPPQTRKTVKNFDPDNTGKLPVFVGDFDCLIQTPVGIHRPSIVTTTLDVQSADGKLAAFPYPLKNLSMKMVVHEEFIEITKASMRRGDGLVELDGRIDWGRRIPGTDEPLVQPDLRLTARNIPIDDDLISALPDAKQKWLRKVNLRGAIDIDGKIIPEKPDSDDIAVDLGVRLSGGTIQLTEGNIGLTDISAEARIGAEKASIVSMKARRGDATVEGRATFDWSNANDPNTTASAQVRSLTIDDALLAALPPKAKEAADALRPKGMVDLDVDYTDDGHRIVLRPRDLAINPRAVPLPMEKIQGQITLDRDRVTLKEVTARAGDATLHASGVIEPKTGMADLTISGRELKVTEALKKSLPPALQRAITAAELSGTVAFDVTKLSVREVDSGTPGKKEKEVAFEGALWLQNATLQVGVPLTGVNGLLKAGGVSRNGQISELSGDVAFDSLKLAGRDVAKLTAKLIKPRNQDLLQIAKIDGRIADGQIGGQIDSILSEKDMRYGLSLVLRNARVTDLTGELDKPIDGRLTASLSLEGKWDDSSTRRGRGDVLVEGKEMYRVPVLFGIMQIANLTLPIESPIQQAGVRYSVEGQRVTLDAIDLRSKTSVMQGAGWLDFGTKQVQMTLTLGNSAADAVPIFGELLKGARQDLLQIRVRGSLEEPKVGASAFNTITTTVDEVLKGDK